MNEVIKQADGTYTVNGAVPVFSGIELATAQKVVDRWEPLAQMNARRTGVPVEEILSFIKAESQGNPNAKSPVGALGLMQIFSKDLKQGLSDAQVMIPANNIRLGSDFLRDLHKKYGSDLVKVAASYNAGHPKPNPNSPWGYGFGETVDYVRRVITGTNTVKPLLRGVSLTTVSTRKENFAWGATLVAGLAYVGYRLSKAA